MPLPPDLLQRPPEEASRLVVLSMLEAAGRASRKLEDPDADDALHDFRVSLRRTRSALRAWRRELRKSVRKRDRRALAGLQRATGGARDAEVALAWLASERSALRPPHRLGHDWLVAQLERRRKGAMSEARSGVREGFEALREELEPRLEVVTIRKHLRRASHETTFASLLAERARESQGRKGCILIYKQSRGGRWPSCGKTQEKAVKGSTRQQLACVCWCGVSCVD